jgi:hypothetical protein
MGTWDGPRKWCGSQFGVTTMVKIRSAFGKLIQDLDPEKQKASTFWLVQYLVISLPILSRWQGGGGSAGTNDVSVQAQQLVQSG